MGAGLLTDKGALCGIVTAFNSPNVTITGISVVKAAVSSAADDGDNSKQWGGDSITLIVLRHPALFFDIIL